MIPKAFSFEGQGDIINTTLDITDVTSGTLTVGSYIYNNINPATQILAQLTGTPGGIGTYELSIDCGTLVGEPIKGFKENTSGTTLGMTVGMPIQFRGLTGDSGIIDSQIYYVSSIVNQIDFTIANSGPPYNSITFNNTFTVGASGLKLLIKQCLLCIILESQLQHKQQHKLMLLLYL